MIQADANHVRAVVPYATGGASVQVTVESVGTPSDPVSVPVAPSSPRIFTWSLLYGVADKGLDRAFMHNADGKQNTPRDPAGRGSIVVFFATGAGQTDPPGLDGKRTDGALSKPVLPVSLRIGGQAAEILYAGAAPGFTAGLMEVHARVPSDAAPGDAVPIEITVDGVASQPRLMTRRRLLIVKQLSVPAQCT